MMSKQIRVAFLLSECDPGKVCLCFSGSCPRSAGLATILPAEISRAPPGQVPTRKKQNSTPHFTLRLDTAPIFPRNTSGDVSCHRLYLTNSQLRHEAGSSASAQVIR